MRRILSYGLVLLGLACLPALSRGDDKNNKKPDLSAASFTKAGEVAGVLQSADKDSITLRLSGVTLQSGGYGKGVQAKENHQDLKFELTPDCKVRVAHLPPLTDDKGKPKKRTPEEIQKLKGAGKLPGYAAEISDLKSNQIVEVQLSKIKGAGPEGKSYVSLILIKGEINTPAKPDGKKDKN